jgi:hypothetical protein
MITCVNSHVLYIFSKKKKNPQITDQILEWEIRNLQNLKITLDDICVIYYEYTPLCQGCKKGIFFLRHLKAATAVDNQHVRH